MPHNGLTAYRATRCLPGWQRHAAGLGLGGASQPSCCGVPALQPHGPVRHGAVDAGETLECSGRGGLWLADARAGCVFRCRHGPGGGLEAILRDPRSQLSILTLPSLPSTMESPSATSPATPRCSAPKVRLCCPLPVWPCPGLQEGPGPPIPAGGELRSQEHRRSQTGMG